MFLSYFWEVKFFSFGKTIAGIKYNKWEAHCSYNFKRSCFLYSTKTISHWLVRELTENKISWDNYELSKAARLFLFVREHDLHACIRTTQRTYIFIYVRYSTRVHHVCSTGRNQIDSATVKNIWPVCCDASRNSALGSHLFFVSFSLSFERLLTR